METIGEIKQAYIMFMRGISMKELKNLDNIFDEKYSAVLNEDSIITYGTIPKKFTGPKTWPRSTNLLCWSCSRNFKTVPYFVASEMQTTSIGEIHMDRIGIFCTPNCTAKYINEKFKNDACWFDMMHRLKILYRELTGKSVEKIMPSPDKTIMIPYCGEDGITEEQYAKKLVEIANEQNIR